MKNLGSVPSTLLALAAAAALTTAAELKSIDTKHTACKRPTQSGDIIFVNYRGTLDDGTEFDSSYSRGPFNFRLGAGQVIKGWDMGLLGMCPGDERRLTIPAELAYGSAGSGPIPGDATLTFETALVGIAGIPQESLAVTATPVRTTVTGVLSTAPTAAATTIGSEAGPLKDGEKPKKRCQLLGPFALLVQGALGGFAILTLVFKRYREKPRRPWKIWFFDVSKQIFGSMLTHVLNVGMSMMSSVQIANHAQNFGTAVQAQNEQGHYPNPCSFYLLNLAIDTTLGIPVLYILLIVVHALCLRTPLARPPQALTSGKYGEPPQWSWYLRQLLIYFIGLTGMKFTVFLLFSALPWLPWVGDWALRWTQFDERLEIAFAMFIFPLMMNAVQYYVIDNLIMDRKREATGYQSVNDEDRLDEEERLVADDATLGGDDTRFKLDDEEDEPLTTADPVPIGGYSSSAGTTIRGDEEVNRKSK